MYRYSLFKHVDNSIGVLSLSQHYSTTECYLSKRVRSKHYRIGLRLEQQFQGARFGFSIQCPHSIPAPNALEAWT